MYNSGYGRELEHFLNRPKICVFCDSNEFEPVMQAAHIKPIPDFSEDTKLGIVNAPDNLAWMCPAITGCMTKD